MIIDFPNYSKFDNDGQYILLDPFIMSFEHFDGFTERLLNIDLIIDKDYNLILRYNSFKFNNILNSDFSFTTRINQIPIFIRDFLKSINERNLNELKGNYIDTGVVIEDSPRQGYLFKFNGKTKYVSINTLEKLKDVYFETVFEKSFFESHKFVSKWTFNLYNEYEKVCGLTYKK